MGCLCNESTFAWHAYNNKRKMREENDILQFVFGNLI